jgi:hypothetical protein
MKLTRRDLLSASAGTITATALCGTAFAQSGPKLPTEASLQSGDFLWPKKPGAIVPYELRPGEEVDAQRARWLKEKNDFIKRARASNDPDLNATADEIEPLTFNDFRTRYLRNLTPGTPTPYGLGGIAAVGHIAIVEVDEKGQRWIIEALWTPAGVTRSTYADWLKGRSGEIVWQGRLKGADQKDRSKIAVEARKWLSKPYDFWNFNLADTSGFYCSKLAWFSVIQSLNIAVDGDSNPKRHFWLSPKQILYSDRIDRLVDPGDYGVE